MSLDIIFEILSPTSDHAIKSAYIKAHKKRLDRKAKAKDKKSIQVPKLFDPDNDIAIFVEKTQVRIKNLKKLASLISFLEYASPKLNVKGLKFISIKDKTTKSWVPSSSTTVSTTNGRRWNSLSHNGVYIPEPYVSKKLKFAGKIVSNPKDEELLGMYAVKLVQEMNPQVRQYTKDFVFIKNYIKGLRDFLSKEALASVRPIFPKSKSDINTWNTHFSDMVKHYIKEKEKGPKSKSDVVEKKKKEILLKEKYGYATVDGVEEEIGNWKVEPPGLFMGRGDHPNRGCIKPRVSSSDVTINISKDKKVPKPSDGKKWADVVHDSASTWIAKWNDHCSGVVKYVFLSKSSKFQGQNTINKYDKARLLGKEIDEIVKSYTKYTKSRDYKKRQIGTVMYMIDNFAFRIGNEKSEGEADTVGASTLKVSNISVKGESVIFDFLGKDSVRYQAIHNVDPVISKCIKEFQKGKSKSDLLFDSITSDDVNKYLKSFGKNLSAKVIRTYRSSMMYLDKLATTPKNATPEQKLQFEKLANREVAILCNHKKKKSANAEANVEKLKKELRELKKERRKMKKEGASDAKLKAMKKKITTRETRLEKSVAEMELSCTTSKMNYIDPRISVAWALKNKIDPKKLFTATMTKNFAWALENTDKDWSYAL